jgi:hypothetical protein
VRRRVWRSARSSVARLGVAAALTVITVSAALASPSGSSTRIAAVQDSVRPIPSQALVRRKFEHARHENLPCLGCHGSGAAHRTTRVRTPGDCATCHHDPVRSLECTRCHRPDGIPATRTVQLTMRIVGESRGRDVTFRHDVHIATTAGLGCKDCHVAEVTLARKRECSSCHSSHHSDRTDCTNCHLPPKRGVHDASVHLTCAGSQCHALGRAPTPTLSRATCLFCHADRRNHEPGGSCAACHRIPGASGLTSNVPASPSRPRARR